MLSFTLGSVSQEVPEIHTLVLRGGGEFVVDRRGYSPEGLAKLLTYAEGRYLRDGARSIAEYPVEPEHIPAWREWAKVAGDGFTLSTPKGKDPEMHVSGSALTRVNDSPETQALMGECPDGAEWSEFYSDCNDTLSAHARAHAEERAGALYSGAIPEGKAGGTQPELGKLKTAVIRALVRYKGVKRSKVPKLPGSVGELREYWLTLDGIPVPSDYSGMGEWFDAIHAAAVALVEKEKEDLKALAI